MPISWGFPISEGERDIGVECRPGAFDGKARAEQQSTKSFWFTGWSLFTCWSKALDHARKNDTARTSDQIRFSRIGSWPLLLVVEFFDCIPKLATVQNKKNKKNPTHDSLSLNVLWCIYCFGGSEAMVRFSQKKKGPVRSAHNPPSQCISNMQSHYNCPQMHTTIQPTWIIVIIVFLLSAWD